MASPPALQQILMGGRVVEPAATTHTRHPASIFKTDARVTFMDLPPEMRMEVYGYLLEEEKPIEIKVISRHHGPREVARYDNHRDKHHRGQIWDKKLKEWVPAPPSHTSILLVSRQIHAEATQVLYGSNTFGFRTTTVLKDFLQLLENRIQYLRYIEIDGEGYIRRSIRSALKLLSQAKSLKKLQFEHVDFCQMYSHKTSITAEKCAKDCKSLLASLRTSYEQQNLSANVLDVVVLHMGSKCLHCPSLAPDSHNRFHSETSWGACACRCSEAEKNHVGLQAKLRALIAKDLGIQENKEEDDGE